MENVLNYEDIAPIIGSLQLQLMNASKMISQLQMRVVELEAENNDLKGKRNGKVKEEAVAP